MSIEHRSKPSVLRSLTGLVLLVLVMLEARAQTAAFMPQNEDCTSMWWAEGFPSHTPAAPWRRVIETGYYAMALDTETLRIPHFGATLGKNGAWRRLPAADLALQIVVNGNSYQATAGGKWSRFTGPRLIESGRFLQRADITDLVFKSQTGESLSVEARFETAAWPSRLGLIFAARPGLQAIRTGESSFGRIGGGFGLDGSNHLEIPHAPELDSGSFTLELWAFVPRDYRVSERTPPWLACKNRNEAADGNFGIMLLNGKAQARMNIGGGNKNQFVIDSKELQLDAWHHLTMSYDGDTLRFFLNGALAGEQLIGRKRNPGRHALVFGRRADNSGDGYHFRGVVDEIRIYGRALKPGEVRQRFRRPEAPSEAVREWSFGADGQASMEKIREAWEGATLEISLTSGQRTLRQRSVGDEVFLALDPVAFEATEISPLIVEAGERPVEFDAARGWHRINLDGIEPVLPAGDPERKNDAIERIPFTLSNPTDREQIARLMFEKTARGIRQRIGSPITGVSAILRDSDGHPTGIPVQLSKNWHNHPEGGVYAGQWFHGISQVRLPPNAQIELELTLAYGHWGGVAAASHSQLSLIGWGSNQLWDESALGSWGESICYDPDQVQADCTITDVRPLMVRSTGKNERWGWTSNVGGGDFFRLFDPPGNRIAHTSMRTTYHRQGPCLTEVSYAGKIGNGITHSTTVSLGRTDDIVRGSYRIRMDVVQPTDFSRFVIFQIGADTYNSTGEQNMAIGNEAGLIREWETSWGGNVYRTEPLEAVGRIPWISLHEGVARKGAKPGAWANRGIVIRSWKAKLGGKATKPWLAERGLTRHKIDSSTLDIIPPPGVTRLEPGDYVEATIEHLVMPQFANDYYGPNEALRDALTKSENTWRMIHREAKANVRRIALTNGTLERRYPDVRITTIDGKAGFTLTGGLGYVPITLTGLKSARGYALSVDGEPVDQSIHGNDFWQTDYNPVSRSWSQTYNIPINDDLPHSIRFSTP